VNSFVILSKFMAMIATFMVLKLSSGTFEADVEVTANFKAQLSGEKASDCHSLRKITFSSNS
jgi:hypothetical protein